ncbi:MAG: acetylglutamate kinase [Shewanella algae]|jgi:acetylglutamate kinase|uniref:Acetylglutamate kinase n=1 Tax=Shewanella chilikensis TaxID=558541 RepID=A0ABX5PHI9_9GAMM|nr:MULTISPECIES: acetylglutamate kinase [Shewanella]MCL1156212.1 acetylglutamate kinase [Shewanella chilikensis]MDO8256618.1 acetylglutamate kinase [Shewanella algae]OHY55212.1 acetylglutamate kinase [Shewanella algae]PSS66449.1 acetylglutamate kinase [Shewanella algae]PYE53685.1 N-acetylglutamate kinase [Shewanella chilikensis]
MSTKDKVLVLKVGGALMQCEMGMARLMDTAAKMLAQGQKVVLVHGGGYLVDEQLKANGMDTVKLDGLRVTPPEQMPIIAGALAGMSNKILQAAAIKAGVASVGMSLADANLVDAVIKDERLGLVGDVSPKDGSYINFVLSQGWMPIVSSIAVSSEGQLLNVNADQAATVLAKLVRGKLVLLSDVSGVLDGKGQLIASLNRSEIDDLVKLGVIEKGMKVKVEAALEVAELMGQPVQVASWRDAAQLAALAQGEAVGTQIKP